MEPFDVSLWAAPLALAIALSVLVAARWVWPLALGVAGLPLGGALGRVAWEILADRPAWRDFGSDFAGYDWVIGFASVGALVGTLVGVAISSRRARRSTGAVERERPSDARR